MPESNKTDCNQISEMLGAFRDMELTIDEADMVESHLTDCAKCKDELASIEMVVAQLQSLPEVPVKDFADLIEARILAAKANVGQEPGAVEGPVNEPKPAAVPALTVVGSNVVPLAKTSGRTAGRFSGRALMAVAAAMILGLVAASTLVPKPATEVAQSPSTTASSQLAAKKLELDRGGMPLSDDIVALYDEDAGNNVSEAGISTNEDGLYAIKM